MATGLYLYCLREPSRCGRDKAGTPPEMKAAAVDGKGRVTIRALEGVEAVVSAVSPENFREMQSKARKDVQWIREKAVAHERVVEEAMGWPANDSGKGRATASLPCRLNPFPVIPVKFGVIFNDEERLALVIGGQRAAIQAVFDRIRAKQEWSVKLFLKDAGTFKDRVREESDILRQQSKALIALPAGMAYFMEEEFNEELERECSRKLDEEALRTFESLKPFAAEAARVKLLDGKLTGRSERMVLNSAALVAAGRWPEFKRAVSEMRGKLAARGFLLEPSGPWPPYHFAEFAHD